MSCGGGAYTHAACLSAPVVILVPASTSLWLLPACLLALTAGHRLGVESAKAGAFVFDDDGNPISDGKVTGTESERRRDTESHGGEASSRQTEGCTRASGHIQTGRTSCMVGTSNCRLSAAN